MTSLVNRHAINEAKETMQDKFPIMVKYFLEDSAAYIEGIKNGIDEDDMEKVKHNSHTLKSSSRQLGADGIADAAMKIESISIKIIEGEAKDDSLLKNLLQEVSDAFILVEPEYKKML